jgi:anthranilate phosphoribosyltransferase
MVVRYLFIFQLRMKAKLRSMNSDLTWVNILTTLLAKKDLSRGEAKWAMNQIMSGEATEAQMGGFLLALRSKGEHIDELSGFVDVMLENSLKFPLGNDAIDIVGTGGDQLGTVNISSMSAILAAACGYPVLKHGSRSASGKTGSSEMLEELGIRLDLTPEQLAKVFAKTQITFFFAPMFHPSLKNVGPTRKSLGVPTTFNFLGPLANPAQPIATALGVANEKMAPLLAAELASRGRIGLVFRGSDGLDELTTTGPSKVWVVFSGSIHEFDFDPLEIGIPRAEISQLIGGNAADNAQVARTVLSNQNQLTGEQIAVRDIVALNAAAGMLAYELSKIDSLEGFDLNSRLSKHFQEAIAAINDGRAFAKLNEWVSASQSAGE